jgi:Transposase IS66 family
MTEDEALQLRKENQELREALRQTQELLRVALARIEELEKQKTPPPAFVKADVPKPAAEENKPRKKREAQHNRARRRAMPTHIVEHHLAVCPQCDLRLGGISLARRREVIDLAPPVPVQITEHRICKGWCAGCQKWQEAPVDVQAEVLGQGRIGVRLASLMATLRTVMRLPIRQIQELLRTLHGFEVSSGEIVEVLQDPDPHLTPRKRQQARVAQQRAFEQQLWALCQPFVQQEVPHQTLCKRVESFLPELCVFVAIPGVPAHNNLAERSVRPLVIARKISGGSRSPKGSQTRMGLASLFGTWMAQGLNPFHQCLALLTSQSSLG